MGWTAGRPLRDRQRRRDHGPVPDLIEFCREHGLPMITIAQLIKATAVRTRSSCGGWPRPASPPWGDFTCYVYESRPRRRAARRHGPQCGPGRGGRAGAGPLRVPDRRRVPARCAATAECSSRRRHGRIAEERAWASWVPAGPRGPGIGIGHKIAYPPGRATAPSGQRRAGTAGSAPAVRDRRRCSTTWASPPCA